MNYMAVNSGEYGIHFHQRRNISQNQGSQKGMKVTEIAKVHSSIEVLVKKQIRLLPHRHKQSFHCNLMSYFQMSKAERS